MQLETTKADASTQVKKPWHRPRLFEVRYPKHFAKLQDRMNWIASMMLDARLSHLDKLVLTRLAMHRNLKTGRCDPSLGLLALELSVGGSEESGCRMLRRSLEKSEGMGWVKRWARHGGDARQRQQSNQYELAIPWDAFPPERTNDRTKSALRPDKNSNTTGHWSPPNREVVIGKKESSVSIDTATFADANAALFVLDFLILEDRPKSMAAILSYAQERGETLTAADVTELQRLGYLTRTPKGTFVLGPKGTDDYDL
jgi:hypothetical protein